MVIAHNMSSINGNYQLKKTEKNIKKNSERLASGYKINRSADDAAGLTISEKMRWQIKGLNRASTNAEDGISMIQVAEGALGEMQDILHRMNELAVQGANDTNTKSDREAIQKELDALQSEINRISDTTTFNTKKLLFHSDQVVNIDADNYSSIPLDEKFSINGRNHYGKAMDFGSVNSSNINKLLNKSFSVNCTAGCSQIFKFQFTDKDTNDVKVEPASSSRPNVTVSIGLGAGSGIKNGSDIINKIKELVEDPTTQNDIMSNSGETPVPGTIYVGHANALDVQGSKLILYGTGGYLSPVAKLDAGQLFCSSEEYNLQVGAKEKQGFAVEFKTVNTSTMGLSSISVADHDAAGRSITTIADALDFVSDFRSYLGAAQNRLEHTVQVDNNTAENTQAAESRIRDTSIEDEMVQYSKNNILQQATQSMLAQSNASKQGVLQLLQ